MLLSANMTINVQPMYAASLLQVYYIPVVSYLTGPKNLKKHCAGDVFAPYSFFSGVFG